MRPINLRTRKSDVSFHWSGRIEISRRTARLLGIEDGDVANVAEHDGRHFLYISRKGCDALGEHKGVCRPTNGNGRHFRAFSVDLCRHLLGALGAGRKASFATGVPALDAHYGVVLPLFTENPIVRA